MNLSETFRMHVPVHRIQDPDRLPSENTLAQLVATGRAKWPQFPISDADFVTFLAQAIAPATLTVELRAADLWLVCACKHQLPGAFDVLETHYMPRVRRLLHRMRHTSETIEDILQELRRKLMELNNVNATEAGYGGRGDLAGWLCIVAARTAGRRQMYEEREVSLESSAGIVLPSADEDPEMAFLQREHRHELLEAFRQTLVSFTARERNLLRYYFLDNLSIDKIAALYGVHRVTASRWINQVRDKVVLNTRENLARQISLSEAGFQRLLGLIASQIRPNIEALVDVLDP